MDYFRNKEPKQTNSHEEGNNTEHPPALNLSSDGTESLTAKTAESSPTPDLVSAPLQEELVSREVSFSASDSYLSYNSTKSFYREGKFNFFKQFEWRLSEPDGKTRCTQFSECSSNNKQEYSASTWSAKDSSNLLEAAEKTIEELHAKAKLWKRDVEKLRKSKGRWGIEDAKKMFKAMIEVEPPSPLRYIIGAAVMLIGVVLPVGYMMFRNKRVPSSSSYSKQTNKVLI
ncbi:hypothetical protein V6N12_025695 [Hibiscus sabdariffa]|uniref:Uncharacterized protein n=1 Tax=Hibiscus sabdariffa TaxID=183260 RepID=A0ABR1Z7I0_9ROSI